MENENDREFNEAGEVIDEYGVSNEEIVEDSSTEVFDNVENVDTSNIEAPIESDITNTNISNYTTLSEVQFNEITDSLSLIKHTNLLISILLFSILIYLFLHNMLDRRKV